MNLKLFGILTLAAAAAVDAPAQSQPGQPVPMYRVTVIERTVKAVNYQYRSAPTQIDFRGTVLLPEAKGAAYVESKEGRVEIEARFDHLLAPARYGREYLTYVLWAITPEGRAKNLGEVLAGSSDKAKLHVTTDLQAFGLIVTAEPYAAVRQPSDVVVMENDIRPDTIGKIEPIEAKYELLPRGQYTYQVPAGQSAAEGNGPRVSMREYEQMVEVYQAQNAVQIARASGAAQYAADTLQRAERLLTEAQDLRASGAENSRVIAEAREAAQTAEDARAITVQRQQDEKVTEAKIDADRERQLRVQAEADKQAALAQAQAARAEAEAAQAQSSAERAALDQERSAREQAAAQAGAVATIPGPTRQPQANLDQQRRALRMDLYRQLGASALETMDTPRGLVVTIHASDFTGHNLGPATASRLSPVAAAIRAYPGLSVKVDDNGDGGRAERANAVREALIADGMPAGAIEVRSMGDSRPILSNRTAAGRQANRRVEIIISGDAIGSMAYWEHMNSIAPR
jgi:flagellar motor protein MotB